MKRLLLSLLFVSLLVPSVIATDYTQDANCQGAWLFTEGSGTTIADASQNSYTGNFKGAGEPAWDSDIPTGYSGISSCLFDETDDYIDCTDISEIGGNADMSAVAWAKHDDGAAGGACIVSKYDEDPITNKVFFMNISPADKFNTSAHEDHGTGTDFTGVAGSTVFTQGIWKHFAMTHDGGSATGERSYIDGVEDGNSPQDASAVSVLQDSATPVYIGRFQDGGTPFGGYITEVGIFDDVLTSTEINDIIDNGLRPVSGQVMMISM